MDSSTFSRGIHARSRLDVVADLLLSSLGEWRAEGHGRFVNDALDAVFVDGRVSMRDAVTGSWRTADRLAVDLTDATELVAELAEQVSA